MCHMALVGAIEDIGRCTGGRYEVCLRTLVVGAIEGF